jgi:hypothetical protein
MLTYIFRLRPDILFTFTSSALMFVRIVLKFNFKKVDSVTEEHYEPLLQTKEEKEKVVQS